MRCGAQPFPRNVRVISVRLLKPGKGETVTYEGTLLIESGGHILIHARWERARLELGYVTFERGDHFFEHYYTERYYTVFELRSAEGDLKGWYCNVARPAEFDGKILTSEDLELDLFVSADRQTVLTLDEDEFVARAFDAETVEAAQAALTDLICRAEEGAAPFDSDVVRLSLR